MAAYTSDIIKAVLTTPSMVTLIHCTDVCGTWAHTPNGDMMQIPTNTCIKVTVVAGVLGMRLAIKVPAA